jgi:cytochrome c oxidase assembly factor CtaG
MDPVVAAALASWTLDVRVLCLLLAMVWLYARGWRRLHRERPARYTAARLAAFLTGVGVLFLAIASPIDAFAGFLLQVHMIQHMLLIMIAPPLIWLGQPVIPILRGLPSRVLTVGLGPFLSSRGLRRLGHAVTHPVFSWLAMTAALIYWHLPRWYELGLNSQSWHAFEHACFFSAALLFWWPVVQVWPSHSVWPRWAMIPYLVLADLVNTALSAWLVFSGHVVYRTYDLGPRLWGISALDDQSTAGAIMWVPGSIAYLVPAFLIGMQAISRGADLLVCAGAPAPALPSRSPAGPPWDLLRLPIVGAILRHRHFRRAAQGAMLLLAAAVVTDGFLGPQLSPLNLAGVLPWTHWRAFTVLALLAAGNLFCMACPFTLTRDLGRRFLPARLRWPRQLRSKWIAVALLALYLWSYEAFSLWDSPWWTAWVIVAYFATAFAVDGFFRGASFCKYVCPIGQFHFVHSLVSPLEVKVREPSVCGSCRTHDCIRGNQTQRGCELYLFQPKKTGNFDCTFCLDCVHACPHDNVGIQAVIPASRLGIGQLSKRLDVAALALILVFGAFVNAAAMVIPVMSSTWFMLAGLVAAPVALTCTCAVLGRWMGHTRASWQQLATTFALALIPLGFSMWIAHFSYHLLTAWRSVIPVVDRILHLPSSGVVMENIPSWWPPSEILLLDCGLLLTLYVAWRIARQRTIGATHPLGLLIPWALLAVSLYAAGLWILFEPMQMRGMVMN